MEIVRTWKHKDAWRYWWEITLWKSGERPCSDGPEIDFVWRYMIRRDERTLFNEGEIVGQYDMAPHLHDVLLDFSQYIQSVCLGFAEYSKAEEEGT